MWPADGVFRSFSRDKAAVLELYVGLGAARFERNAEPGRARPIHFMRWITRLKPAGSSTRIMQSLEYSEADILRQC